MLLNMYTKISIHSYHAFHVSSRVSVEVNLSMVNGLEQKDVVIYLFLNDQTLRGRTEVF